MNYSNNAYSVLNGPITSAATAIQLATGTGSRFPVSDFRATLVGYDVNGNENAWEIVHCSTRSGDALTVTRGQEGTSAVAWANGARIENRITAGVMAALEPTITPGTTSQYLRGDKSWRDFFTDVRAATLTGLSTATNAVIAAGDTVLSALGKLQKQVSDNLTSFNSHTGSGGAAHASATTSVAGFMSPSDKAKSDYLNISYGGAILSVLPSVADTNADLKLSGKGSGVVRIGSAHLILGDGAAAAWESGTNTIRAIQFGDASAIAERSASGEQSGYFCINCYFDGAGWKYKTAGPAALMQVSSGGMNFRFTATGSADAAITWTQYLAAGASGSIIDVGGNELGFKGIPQNSQSAACTLVLSDAGKHIFHPAADTTARTFTIPANSAVAFPIGTAITFINQNGTGGVVTIAITTDTMRLAGAGTTGSRTLARNGVATAIKITATEWIISGTGLT